MCKNIARFKVKGQGPRKPANPEEEPDFYAQELMASALAVPPSSISASLPPILNSQLLAAAGGAGAGNPMLAAGMIGIRQELIQRLILQNSIIRASLPPTMTEGVSSGLLAAAGAGARPSVAAPSNVTTGSLLDYLSIVDPASRPTPTLAQHLASIADPTGLWRSSIPWPSSSGPRVVDLEVSAENNSE